MDYVGKKVFIQTVTLYYTGQVVEQDKKELRLTNAAFIADTGRLSNALNTCEFSEVEPFPHDIYILRGAIVCITTIDSLPERVK